MSTDYEMYEDDEGNPLVAEAPERTHKARVNVEDVSGWLWLAADYFYQEISIREGAEWNRRDGTDEAFDTIELEVQMIPRARPGDFAILVDGKTFVVSVRQERKR